MKGKHYYLILQKQKIIELWLKYILPDWILSGRVFCVFIKIIFNKCNKQITSVGILSERKKEVDCSRHLDREGGIFYETIFFR